VLIFSPLALITQTHLGHGALDFISSIEIILMDRADVISMQNWSQIIACLKKVNRIPEHWNKSDIIRVRQWYLSGQAYFYRQTIVLSSHTSVEMHSLIFHNCRNHNGVWRLTINPRGLLSTVSVMTDDSCRDVKCSHE